MNTNIEKIISLLQQYPLFSDYDMSVDYSVKQDPNITFTPNGATVTNVSMDIYGNADVTYSYNCVLLLTRKILAGELGLENQIYIEDLQNWIINQNFTDLKVQFGDNPNEEFLIADSASLLSIDEQASRAIYSLRLSVNYKKHYNSNI